MIEKYQKVIYKAVIQHLKDVGAEYIDKSPRNGGVYFYDEEIAKELYAKGYKPRYAKYGIKESNKRPMWYVWYE